MRSLSRREALRGGLLAAGSLGLAALPGCTSGRTATTSPPTSAAELTSFVPSAKAGPATGLPRRVGWVPTANTEFFVAFGKGMAAAAADRGLEFVTTTSGADSSANVHDIDTVLARGVGALALQPLDQGAQRPSLQRALGRGVCVQGIITDPCTVQIAASQYRIGYEQGRAAATYIRSHLHGRADVQYFNLDTLSPQLKVRHAGVLAGLRTGGSGVRVVGDLTVADVSPAAGFAAMNTVIQAHPSISVVLGGDSVVVGAYRALQQAGKLRADMYLSGVDGDSDALALVAQGGPYRASTAFPWALMGYGMGQFGADWIEGREVPRVVVATGQVLTDAAQVAAFRADNAAPAAVFADRSRYTRYLPLLGSVDYRSRSTVWRTEVTPP